VTKGKVQFGAPFEDKILGSVYELGTEDIKDFTEKQ
jgi:hypothetical protein